MTIWQSKLDSIKGQWNSSQLSQLPGLFALPHLCSVSVLGEEAEKFLQGQLTCDLKEITETQFRLGACCTPKGRMVAIFRIFKVENGYQFVVDVEVAEAFIKHLSKYIPFFKAEVAESIPPQAFLGLSVNLTELSNLSDSDECNLCAYGSAKLMRYSENRWLLIVNAEELDKYWLQFEKRELIAASEDWQYLDIKQKLASIKANTIEKFLPHETGLAEAGGVSYTKGCYTGQEIVARMHYLGKLNKHLQLLESSIDFELPPGDSITALINNKPTKIGDLVNISSNSAQQSLVLICLKDKYLELGEFAVNGEKTSILKVI